MKFGPQYKKLPTPSSVTLFVRLFIRFLAFVTVIVQLIPLTEIWKSIVSATLVLLMGCANDMQDWAGVYLKGPVSAKDVESVKDGAKSIDTNKE